MAGLKGIATKGKPEKCCNCGSLDLATGILTLDRPAVLEAFPELRPRKRFPLCRTCRSKIRWTEDTGSEYDPRASSELGRPKTKEPPR